MILKEVYGFLVPFYIKMNNFDKAKMMSSWTLWLKNSEFLIKKNEKYWKTYENRRKAIQSLPHTEI